LGTDYDTQLRDIGKAYGRGVTGLETGYARRGIHDSGIRQKGYADYSAIAGPSGRQEQDLLTGLYSGMTDVVGQELGALGAYGGEQWGRGLGAATQSITDVTGNEALRQSLAPFLKEAMA